jgi:hypothetical protein
MYLHALNCIPDTTCFFLLRAIESKKTESERQSTAIVAEETENNVKLQQELQESTHLAP